LELRKIELLEVWVRLVSPFETSFGRTVERPAILVRVEEKGGEEGWAEVVADSGPWYIVMIQVGSGQQSNPFNANSLAAPIANGSGQGQLVYGQPSVPSNITVSGSSAYFIISQTFNNSSGSAITITEVGIVVNIQTISSNGANSTNFGNVLVWYDVLSSSISVPNGGSVTIYYTFTVNP